MISATPTPDAVPDSWTLRLAPAWARPYLRLARVDRPVGTWLLLWPCWWSVTLAGPAAARQWPSLWLLLLFAVGALAMRSAGCVYNDIVDKDIDAQVERTRNRPLASGALSLQAAWLFLAVLCLVGLGVLLCLNRFAFWLGLASLALVALYPFMKRLTYWPQAFLGLAFSWGALMGYAAVTGRLGAAPLLLYGAGIAWTLGYDTIYAHQDKDDDALIGVKSSALKLGARTQQWLVWFYGAMLALLVAAGWAAGLGRWFFILLSLAAAHLLWQILTLDIDDPARCLKLFRANRDTGALVFVAILAGSLTAVPPPVFVDT